MKIIEPKAELWLQEDDPISHVAKCTRVCYGNAVSKGEKADALLVQNLLNSKHLSMFRHESVYAIIPYGYEAFTTHLEDYNKCPYIASQLDTSGKEPKWLIATNMNFLLDCAKDVCAQSSYHLASIIKRHCVSPKEFAKNSVGKCMMRYTFHITTQISTSRELNRVSPNSIAEKSTRYVREDGVICRPHWMSVEESEAYLSGKQLPASLNLQFCQEYLISCERSFNKYKELIELGMKREDARGVLPLDTATEVVYTYSVNEWRHIINLRADKCAHPNCNIIANLIKNELENLGYEL